MPGRTKGSRSNSQIPASQQSVSRVVVVDEEEDMVVEETQDDIAASQAVSQAKKVLANISADIVNKKVNDLVQYLLIMERRKYPIKRIEINRVVLKEHSKAFVVFMDKAKKVLKEVFGLNLVEIDAKQKSYILVNTIDMMEQDSDDRIQMEISNEEKAKMGLVMVILSVIFMKGNVVQDDELYNFLKKIGVDINATHEVFGDVKKFITTELARQGYLDFQRLRNIEPVIHEVRWGPRAKHEFSKMNVLIWVCKIFKQDNLSMWTDQYKDAEESVVNKKA